MNTSKRGATLAAAVALLLLYGCSAGRPSERAAQLLPIDRARSGSENRVAPAEPTISIVPKSLDNPIFLDAKEAAEREGQKLGVHIDWVGPFSTNTGRQIEIVRWLIKRHVAGILISCNDPIALEPVIDEGIAAGVKIATFDSDSPDSKRLFYVGTDNSALGSAAASTLVGILRARHLLPSTGVVPDHPLTVVIISGRREAYNLDERISAFKATASKQLNLRFLPTLYSNDSISRTIDLTGQITDSHPHLSIIFFTGGWLFYAPIESMKGYAAWIRSGGIAVTIDATYPVLTAAKRGLVQGVIGQNFRQMGRIGVEMLYRAIHGERVPKLIYTGISKVTKGDLASFLRMTKNYEIR